MCGAGSQTVPGRCALHKIMQPTEHELTCGVAAGASCTATAHLPHQLACKPGNVGFHTGCLESREVAQRSRLPEHPTHPQNAYALVTRHQPTRLQRLRLPTQALAQAPPQGADLPVRPQAYFHRAADQRWRESRVSGRRRAGVPTCKCASTRAQSRRPCVAPPLLARSRPVSPRSRRSPPSSNFFPLLAVCVWEFLARNALLTHRLSCFLPARVRWAWPCAPHLH